KEGRSLDPGSDGSDILSLQFLDSIAGQVAVGLLTHGADNRFGRLIDQLGDRNFLQVNLVRACNCAGEPSPPSSSTFPPPAPPISPGTQSSAKTPITASRPARTASNSSDASWSRRLLPLREVTHGPHSTRPPLP